MAMMLGMLQSAFGGWIPLPALHHNAASVHFVKPLSGPLLPPSAMASCSNKASSSAAHSGKIDEGGGSSWQVPHNTGHISGTEKMPKASSGKSQNAIMFGLAQRSGSSLPLHAEAVGVVIVAVDVVLVVVAVVVVVAVAVAVQTSHMMGHLSLMTVPKVGSLHESTPTNPQVGASSTPLHNLTPFPAAVSASSTMQVSHRAGQSSVTSNNAKFSGALQNVARSCVHAVGSCFPLQDGRVDVVLEDDVIADVDVDVDVECFDAVPGHVSHNNGQLART